LVAGSWSGHACCSDRAQDRHITEKRQAATDIEPGSDKIETPEVFWGYWDVGSVQHPFNIAIWDACACFYQDLPPGCHQEVVPDVQPCPSVICESSVSMDVISFETYCDAEPSSHSALKMQI